MHFKHIWRRTVASVASCTSCMHNPCMHFLSSHITCTEVLKDKEGAGTEFEGDCVTMLGGDGTRQQ